LIENFRVASLRSEHDMVVVTLHGSYRTIQSYPIRQRRQQFLYIRLGATDNRPPTRAILHLQQAVVVKETDDESGRKL
jgi:hypothetical protein